MPFLQAFIALSSSLSWASVFWRLFLWIFWWLKEIRLFQLHQWKAHLLFLVNIYPTSNNKGHFPLVTYPFTLPWFVSMAVSGYLWFGCWHLSSMSLLFMSCKCYPSSLYANIFCSRRGKMKIQFTLLGFLQKKLVIGKTSTMISYAYINTFIIPLTDTLKDTNSHSDSVADSIEERPYIINALKQIIMEFQAVAHQNQQERKPLCWTRVAKIIDVIFFLLYIATVCVFLILLCKAWFPWVNIPLQVCRWDYSCLYLEMN